MLKTITAVHTVFSKCYKQASASFTLTQAPHRISNLLIKKGSEEAVVNFQVTLYSVRLSRTGKSLETQKNDSRFKKIPGASPRVICKLVGCRLPTKLVP